MNHWDLKLDICSGDVSILSITCLPGKERYAFCYSVRSMCDKNKAGFTIICDYDDVFPIVVHCLCGVDYVFNEVNEVPIVSKQCECGVYVVKYENHTIH